MTLDSNRKKQVNLIPKGATWIQDKVETFNPSQNTVVLRGGEEISYEYMVIAMGIHLRFDMIKGAVEALETPGVCSNYSPFHVQKHYQEVMNFQKGNAIYTFPNTPIKCAGAPQKACYITDSILRQRGVRDKAHMIYATSLSKIFGVDHYVKALEKVAQEKTIEVKTKRNLIEVVTNNKKAIFELLGDDSKPTGVTEEIEFSLLHISPPCTAPEPLRSSHFADKTGFMDVDPQTLQSKNYPNVFGVGDCMNTPNAKTAASVSTHLKTVDTNLTQVMQGARPFMKYDGYASCPLVVSTNRVILAEFSPNEILETTPLNQSKPSYWAFLMKRYILPVLYWKGLIKGHWNGPSTIRNFSRLLKTK
ncbi:Sulfide:quinone oxidoreductase, mitochondrial [Caenorhabditis elegans]|nr:FAD/NAD(P)-binding domain-containing protein [Caenorhabditis elegans]CCD68699.1 FAD/NAD(P)-binding domain-containing protein [Caenorhabditis elegans]|eukprot:NP_500688.2 Uncharacterized protein CELE_Y9C9A.16 [Caenorhabditis elegans]